MSWWGRWPAAGVAVVVVAAGLVVTPLPEPAASAPPGVDDDVSVAGRSLPDVVARESAAEQATVVTSADAPEPVWPGAGAATVSVPAGGGGSQGQAAAAGVSVLAAGAAAEALRPGAGAEWSKAGPGEVSTTQPERVGGLTAGDVSRVRVVGWSRSAARQVGAAQVFSVERADGAVASSGVDVRVDYSAYAEAFGANYADRLRLVRLPACAFEGRSWSQCRAAPRPVEAVNNPAAGTLTARLPVSGDVSARRGLAARLGEPRPQPGSVFAVMSTGQGASTGDYEATDLNPDGTWQVGLSSGAFTYSYPVPQPPLAAGSGLDMSLSYNSQSVDAFTQSTNNQSGWTGLGWNLDPGFIERRFRPCAEDVGDGSPKERSDQQYWGNLCWESPDENDGEGDTTDYSTSELYLSLNGKSTRIVKDRVSGQWKTEQDFGWELELTSGGSGKDYWQVSTLDGTRYRFGYTDDANLWVPVVGDDPGEPHYDNYPTSYQQTWRWNLDRVEDRTENVTTLNWDEETNYYKRYLSGNVLTYDRGAHLESIEYGYNTQTGGSKPIAKVDFRSIDRCVEGTVRADPVADPYSSSVCPSVSESNASSYPDVPVDLKCSSSSCGQYSPTFWSTKRLDRITTYKWSESKDTWINIYRLQLRFKTLNPPGLTGKVLWLDRIFPVGLIGSDANKVRLPGVNFDVEYLSGRVDHAEAEHGVSEMILPRVYRVYNGYGGRTDVTYGHVAPCPTSGSGTGNDEYWDWYASKVGNWDVNTEECAPVWFKPEGAPAGWGQFHKYLALKVVDQDLVGGSPDVVTEYEYRGDAAWALGYGFIDSTGATESWNEWRGYPTVRVHTGSGSDPDDYSMTETTFFRGLYYDFYDDWSTRKHVKITNYDGGTHNDLPGKAGRPLQVRHYQMTSYDSDPAERSYSEVSSSRFAYEWINTGDGPGRRNPYLAPFGYQRDRVKLDDGSWRERSVNPRLFNDYGLPGEIVDNGKIGVPDSTCTSITYASRDAGAHYNINFPETVQVWDSGTCGTGELISKTVNLYDGRGTSDIGSQNPYDADLTEKRVYTSETEYVATKASYDNYGRQTSTTDERGQTTTIDYDPPVNWPGNGITTTNPAGHTTTTWVSPSYGQPGYVIDTNGQRTDINYDQLGRPVQVFLPGDPESAGIASLTFDYTYTYTYNGTTGQPQAATRVGTHTLQSKDSGGQYLSQYVFDDGFGRVRETQTASPAGGRVVQATYYDARGMQAAASAAFHNTGQPGDGLVNPATSTLPSWARTTHDTLGRPTAQVAMAENTELWRSTTGYHGDHHVITPPAGAATVTLWHDVRGNTTLRQEHLPGGDTVDTSYSYDLEGQLTAVVDDAGNQWAYTYDLAGRQTQASDPDAGVTTNVYDDAGNLVATTDARGQTVTTDYDTLGRPTTRWHGAAGTGVKAAEWVYDTLAAGQLTSATAWHDGHPYTTTIDGYTDRYQPTGRTVTIPAVEGGLAGDYPYAYTYTDTGQPETVTLPAAGGMPAETLSTSYTDLGQVDRLTSDHDSGTTYVDATSYDKTGDLIQQLLGAAGARVARDLAWDQATGRLDAITTVTGADTATPATVQDDAYTYDPAGNLTSIADHTTGQAQCFTYDTLRRLEQAWTTATAACSDPPAAATVDGPDPYWHTWSFDSVGNRLTATEHPTATTSGTTTTTYTYPDAGDPQPHTLTQRAVTDDQGTVVEGYDYDQAGNTTSRPGDNGAQTLTWTPEGNLESVTDSAGTSDYVYGPDGGRLITHHADGSATLYLPEGVEVHVDAFDTVSCTRYYGDIAVRTADGLTWRAADHHNTATHTIEADTGQTTTRRLDPYGNPRGPVTGGTWPDDKGFLGAPQDPTGLTHLGARQYDPTTGRFISLDPIMDLTDPQQMHGYTYANHNPLTWADPTGLLLGVGLIDGYSIGALRDKGNVSGLDQRCYAHACGNPGRPNIPNASSGGTGASASSSGASNKWLDFIRGAVDGANNHGPDTAKGAWEAVTDPVGAFRSMATEANYWAVHYTGMPVNHTNRELAVFCAISGACQIYEDWQDGDSYSAGYGSSQLAGDAAFAAAGAAIPGGSLIGVTSRLLRVTRAFCSFSEDTEVLLADGSSKPIGEMEPGDQVQAADPETGKEGSRQVVAVWMHDDTLVDLKLDNGKTISTTVDHPFWNHTDQQWQPAGTLDPGDELLTAGPGTATVAGLDHTTSRPDTTYNLTVADIHTYYVLAGDSPVLVHNAGGDVDPINFGNGFTGRVDQYVSRGGQASFEIHVYRNGQQYGFYGSNGWFSKHSIPVPTDVPQQLENALKGHAVDMMRRNGQLGAGDTVKGDSWKRPRIESGC